MSGGPGGNTIAGPDYITFNAFGEHDPKTHGNVHHDTHGISSDKFGGNLELGTASALKDMNGNGPLDDERHEPVGSEHNLFVITCNHETIHHCFILVDGDAKRKDN